MRKALIGIIFLITLLVLLLQLPIIGHIIFPTPSGYCGDGVCDFYTEDIETCYEDCSVYCGDGICSPIEYRCVEGLGRERLCEEDCGKCPPDLTADAFIPLCVGDLKRYEKWCWLGVGVIVNTSMKGARDYGDATVVTWIRNSGGEDLRNLSYSIRCDHDYRHLNVYFDGKTDLLKKGHSIPLVIKFEKVYGVKDTYRCIVKIRAQPAQILERELLVRFI